MIETISNSADSEKIEDEKKDATAADSYEGWL